jgi:hypothetical protein
MLQVEACSKLSGESATCNFQTKADYLPNIRKANNIGQEDHGLEVASLLQKLHGIASILGKIEAQRTTSMTTCPLAQAPRFMMPSSPAPASLNVLEKAGGALAHGAALLLDQWGVTQVPSTPASQQERIHMKACKHEDQQHRGCLHQ